MNLDISGRSFEEAIECALLPYGPDACAGETNVVRETPPPYGDTPPGGYHKRSPEDYIRARFAGRKIAEAPEPPGNQAT